MNVGKRAHFLEEIQFHGIFPFFIDRGQAVSPQADVDFGAGQFAERELAVPEIGMTARAMGHADFFSAEQRRIVFAEIIDVDREQIFFQNAGAFQVPDGGAEAAIGHRALIALEPVEEFAASLGEHLEFLEGFGDVDGQGPFPAVRGPAAQPQQFGHGGVGCVRRQDGAAASGRK